MKKFSRIIFLILIAELIVGGGGRLVSFGPVSLRMILFAVATLLSVFYFLKGRRMSKAFNIFLGLFLTSLSIGLVIGVLSGAERTLWLEDIKPLAYVLILPFFYFVIEENSDTRPIAWLIVGGSLFMSAMFFIVLAMIHLNIMPFLSFYESVINTGEFFFRAETTFFFKGFVYLCIALIFVYFIRIRFRYTIAFILGFAIVLSFTRGFIFALGLTYVFYALLETKYAHVVGALVITALIIFFSKPIIYNLSAGIHQLKGLGKDVPKDRLLGNRDESDSGRIQQAKEVMSESTFLSYIVGHGFGNGVPSRPVHMEVSYLEIFHKQGMIGLALWSYLFYLLFKGYRSSRKDHYDKAFYYSACFLFFQSITNQFINNPIGLSFLLLSLTYFHFNTLERKTAEKGKRNVSRHQKSDEISITSF